MKITILQRNIEWANPQANVERADEAINRLPDADLFVLPEMFSTGFCTVTVLLPEVWQCRKMENIITVSILYILTARCSIMIKSIYLLMEERISGLLPERKGWW